MRRIQMRLMIYLDGLLTMRESLKEILSGRDAVIFVLQKLDFALNRESLR